MEVLTAYVREKAPRQGEYAEAAAAKPPTDIQAIRTVLGRRETTGRNRGTDRLDLSNTHLAGVVLRGANLSRTNLSGADLSEARNLTAAQLRRAINWHTATVRTA